MQNLRINTLIGLLLILFLGYYGSISLFTHTHIVDGVRVTHSHPYLPSDAGNQPGHQHTSGDLAAIHALSNFTAVCLCLILASDGFRRMRRNTFPKTATPRAVIVFPLLSNGLRAPPFNINP